MAMARNFGGWLSDVLSGRSGLDGAERDPAARRPAQEVFPEPGISLAAGLILGAAIGAGLAWLDDPLGRGVSAGALVGAILGTLLGLSRAVGRSVSLVAIPEPAPPEPEARLWDSWLDTGHDLIWVEPEGQVTPAVSLPDPEERPRVQPRVISPISGESVLLHDEIGALVERGAWQGAVAIVGGPGSGKTTALRHLEAVLPTWAKFKLIDDVSPFKTSLIGRSDVQLAIFTTWGRELPQNRMAVYRLAPWTRDDRIEYLLKAHGSRCASVMGRLKEAGDEDFLGGIPELWTVVLDRLASDETIGDVRTALGRELDERMSNRVLRHHIGALCLNAIRKREMVVFGDVRGIEPEERISARWLGGSLEGDRALVRLLRHPPVQILMAAGWLAENLIRRGTRDVLAGQLPRALVHETGRLIAGSASAIQTLRLLLAGSDRQCDPMAVSLLHAAGVNWRPDRRRRPDLHGAYLVGIDWGGMNLKSVNLAEADLERALLCNANLENAQASKARLAGADLSDAYLEDCIAPART